MFKAMDEYNNLVWIDDAVLNANYYCPICKSSLLIKAKHSEAVAIHFAHKTIKDCDTFTHDMSDWHKNWQNIFPVKNQEVPLPFDKPCHRADVLAYGYVIEFQHSPISVQEFDERNQFYTSIGKRVIWIFDMNKKYKEGSFSIVESNYVYDGKYIDSNGRLHKKWIVNEYRIGNTLNAICGPPEIVEDTGVGYLYDRNSFNTKQKTHEWKWLRPLNNLIHYNPTVNNNIIIFFEFKPGLLQKVIWCDDKIDEHIAGTIAEGLHDFGEEYFTPSVSNYLAYRNKFIIKSDFRYFTATEYTIKEFLLAVKNQIL